MAHSYINIKERRSKIVPKILGFSVYQIIGKKCDNMRVEPCFPKDEGE